MIESSKYIGRFAPSPSGDLHFGSLIAAVSSFLQARSKGGKWLIRIEDIDPPREVKGSVERILLELKKMGMESDDPVHYQSKQIQRYRACKDALLKNNQAFRCNCSRNSIPKGAVYPGTCRHKAHDSSIPTSVRVRADNSIIRFIDALQGPVEQDIGKECGDFVIWRADKLPAYQLAVVIDDARQGVSEVVRGADLLDSTCRQIFLQRLLGLPTPAYVHLPYASKNGKKLSKRFNSDPISQRKPADAISAALEFLGHPAPSGLELKALWGWAIEHWNIERIPRQKEIPID
ncbi:MAG: glutamyl-Q tRNA(Asp) synthetase [Rhodothermales bacterium]